MNEEAKLEALIESARKGETESIYQLWQTLRPIWERWKKTTYIDQLDRDDLEQQSYMILMESLTKYRTDTEMKFPGFYKVRLHIWRARMSRRITFIHAGEEGIEEKLERVSDSTNVAQEVEDRVLGEVILHYIQELETQEKQILIMSFLENLDSKAIGKSLDLSPEVVRKRKSRSLEKIKKYFR